MKFLWIFYYFPIKNHTIVSCFPGTCDFRIEAELAELEQLLEDCESFRLRCEGAPAGHGAGSWQKGLVKSWKSNHMFHGCLAAQHLGWGDSGRLGLGSWKLPVYRIEKGVSRSFAIWLDLGEIGDGVAHGFLVFHVILEANLKSYAVRAIWRTRTTTSLSIVEGGAKWSSSFTTSRCLGPQEGAPVKIKKMRCCHCSGLAEPFHIANLVPLILSGPPSPKE